jgi:hypothetical protein
VRVTWYVPETTFEKSGRGIEYVLVAVVQPLGPQFVVSSHPTELPGEPEALAVIVRVASPDESVIWPEYVSDAENEDEPVKVPQVGSLYVQLIVPPRLPEPVTCPWSFEVSVLVPDIVIDSVM